MKITLNSKEMEVPDQITVDALKQLLQLPQSGVAVAVNGKIVLTGDHATFALGENDDVILIGAAYGG